MYMCVLCAITSCLVEASGQPSYRELTLLCKGGVPIGIVGVDMCGVPWDFHLWVYVHVWVVGVCTCV